MIAILYLWIGSGILTIKLLLLIYSSFVFYIPEEDHVFGQNM